MLGTKNEDFWASAALILFLVIFTTAWECRTFLEFVFEYRKRKTTHIFYYYCQFTLQVL